MTGFFNCHQLAPRRNGAERRSHLFYGAKRITRPMDEQRWSQQPREVLGTELFNLARRMQRIGEQEQSIGDGGRLRSQKGCLPPSVRVPTEDDEFRCDLTHCFGGALQSLPIARGCARERRTGGVHLAIRKIAAQNVKSGAGECFRYRAQ